MIILAFLINLMHASLDPLTFAKRMVAAYQEAYAHESDHTLSAIDLHVLGGFVSNFSQVAEFFTTQLRGNNRNRREKYDKKIDW